MQGHRTAPALDLLWSVLKGPWLCNSLVLSGCRPRLHRRVHSACGHGQGLSVKDFRTPGEERKRKGTGGKKGLEILLLYVAKLRMGIPPLLSGILCIFTRVLVPTAYSPSLSGLQIVGSVCSALKQKKGTHSAVPALCLVQRCS